jgi:ATP-dependent Clp protease ATP-binding subunit ClpA
MPEFPIPLDNLITYVKTLHPDGRPLDNLSDAVAVSARLDEQSDALIGYFVDQARRSGASWSEIGTSMGVSKQAAQKRFVPRLNADELVPEGQLFSRFTPRSRSTLAAAAQVAAGAGTGAIEDSHMVVGLLAEPDGIAAKILHDHGLSDEQICAAFGLQPAGGGRDSDPAALRTLQFADSGKAVLTGTLKSVLRLGHNYVGTEHLLIGVLMADGDAARTLAGLGVTVELTEAALAREFARIQSARTSGGASS